MYYPFNSRNTEYKSIFGAVASGQTLRLRLLLHKDAKVFEAYLRIICDGSETVREIAMSPSSQLEDYIWYECEISLTTGLYFYSFRYTSEFGEFFVTSFENNIGRVSSEGKWWQLTCYDSTFKTPDWLKGGIIYQIFPDRFFASGKKKQNVPKDRYIVRNWNKQPEYRQNNGPCSLGNDYYGGDLDGIAQKLPYIASLGVNCIYLNPVFEAHSNHRYNTADYSKIDSLLGNEKDLEKLCKKAEKYGISIILDGVFSHTGDDSLYFNKQNRYDSCGAFANIDSPYREWFKFDSSQIGYKCWWGVPSLPEVIEENPNFDEFITGENGILRKWMRTGVKGWRLDVADELPDSFLDNIRMAVKSENNEGLILGEVWEDASNKISYGKRRRYLQGAQLDSVMNYPFAEAIITFIKGANGYELMDKVMTVLENYPKCVIDVLMNHLGTHDTARLLTLLGKDAPLPSTREEQATSFLSNEERELGIKRLKLAAIIQYTLPGIPSLFYGDEAGIEGYGDPFCRATFPWKSGNCSLTQFYKWLGKFRSTCPVFAKGNFTPIVAGLGTVAYTREDDKTKILIAVNRWYEDDYIELPDEFNQAETIYGEKTNGTKLNIKGLDFAILKIEKTP